VQFTGAVTFAVRGVSKQCDVRKKHIYSSFYFTYSTCVEC
jgi:hypothetical protein